MKNYYDIADNYFKNLKTIIALIEQIKNMNNVFNENDSEKIQIIALNYSKLSNDLISQYVNTSNIINAFTNKCFANFYGDLILRAIQHRQRFSMWTRPMWINNNDTKKYMCDIFESLPNICNYMENDDLIKTLHQHTAALQDKINVLTSNDD